MNLPTLESLSNRFGGDWTSSETPSCCRWTGVVDKVSVVLWSDSLSGGPFVSIAISESRTKVCEVEGQTWSEVVETSLELARRHHSLERPITWREDIQ
jgi:hypothetical protein